MAMHFFTMIFLFKHTPYLTSYIILALIKYCTWYLMLNQGIILVTQGTSHS